MGGGQHYFTWFGRGWGVGNKFFLSNLVIYLFFFQLYCFLINYLAIYTTILSINVYYTSQFLYTGILFI